MLKLKNTPLASSIPPPPLLATMTGQRKILIVTDSRQRFITPSISVAKRLLKMGVDVTLSTSFSGIRRIGKKSTPHGLTLAPFSDNPDNTTLEQFITDFASNGALAVAEMISSAAAAGQPYDHLVYTTIIPWAATVANAHNVKSILLWCQPAIALVIYYYYFNGYESLISNPTSTISLPGLQPLNVADVPSFLLSSRPKEHHFVLQIFKDHIDALKTSSSVLANSFNELELECFRAIDKPEFFLIGPLVSSDKPEDNDDCIQGLNTKTKSSVVYVSFGTLATLSMDQIEEIAIGLLESGRPFLWVIRDREQAGRLSKKEELQKQGMIVSWCSQVAVLRHQAIGCFVTHGGWNSTLEALVARVPTVVFPQWSDQETNGKMIEDVWKTGVKVKKKREGDGVVEGKEIERCVEMVMVGDDGGEMRKNAEKWQDLAQEALNNDGSSTLNLQAFLDNTIYAT